MLHVKECATGAKSIHWSGRRVGREQCGRAQAASDGGQSAQGKAGEGGGTRVREKAVTGQVASHISGSPRQASTQAVTWIGEGGVLSAG